MNKTIFGLAYLNLNWEKNKKDLLDSYIPLICEIIIKYDLNELEREKLQECILERLGINIPLHVISGLLTRMKKMGLVEVKDKVYDVARRTDIAKLVNEIDSNRLNTEFNQLIDDIINYSQEEYGVKLEKFDVENGILDFLSENSAALLFGTDPEYKVIEEKITKSKKIRYIISNFIYVIYRSNKDRFNTILQLSKGFSIASVLSYRDFKAYSGKLDEVEIFFDAPVIFNILKVNGESNFLATDELLKTLKRNNAKLRVFKVNEGEVISTTEDAIRRLTSGNYELEKSSRILRTAIREGYSASDLQIKLNGLEKVFKSYGIKVIDFPPYEKNEYKYQINEQKLNYQIKENYKKAREIKFLSWYSKNQIERDVQCISATFRIRKDQRARTIKTSKAIFITNNTMLAFTAKIFEQKESTFVSAIPICITDSFLSSIMWLNYRATTDSVNIKQLLSTCYSNIELDNQILKQYIQDVKMKHEDGFLTDEQFYLLSSNNTSFKLLQEKTLNDIEEYTDRTPSEILEEMTFRQEEKIRQEKVKYDKIRQRISSISETISKSITIICAILLVLGYIFLKPLGVNFELDISSIIVSAIVIFLTLFGVLRWARLIPDIIGVESILYKAIYKRLCSFLNIEE